MCIYMFGVYGLGLRALNPKPETYYTLNLNPKP